MGEFARVEIATEAAQLVDTAIETLEAELAARGVIGWEPNEGNLGIIILGVVAAMAANSATIASTLLEAAFRVYGTRLVKLAFNEGANATANTKWKLLEEGGEFPARTIEAGTQLEAGGLAFYVETEVKVPKGTSEPLITVTAAERGTEYNGLTGVIQLVNTSNFVSEVLIVGETTGGVGQETDEEYLNRLAQILELQAPRPITAGNFAQMVLDATTGVEVGRATAIDGYNPGTTEFEGTPIKAGNKLKEVTSFTGISAEKTSGSQSHPGSLIEGTGIPAGTTVVSVNEGAKEITLSATPSSEPGKEKLKARGSYENQRTVTVFVLGKKAAALTTEQRATLKAYLEERRELNFVIFVEPPSEKNEVRVKATVHVLPGYTAAAVVANVKTALENYLSEETYGNPNQTASGSQTWLNATEAYGVVRYNQIIGVIEAVAGVAYVPSGSSGLAIGRAEAPGSKTADLTLIGPAPLPFTVPANIEVTSV